MKPEQKMWQILRDNFKQPGDRLDRVENGIGEGSPDVNGCLDGEDIWIELKAPKEPARATTALMANNHKLLPSQINWMQRQRAAGGIAFILIRTDMKRWLLIDGTQHCDGFNGYTMAQMIASSIFYITSKSVPVLTWKELRYVIVTKSRYHRLHRHKSAQDAINDMERGALADHPQPKGSAGRPARKGAEVNTGRRAKRA